MSFGKNRVQYQKAYWQYLRYQRFDVYFDKEGRELADFVAKNAPAVIHDLEQEFHVSYSKRILFVVCNSLQDFKQTNIGLSTSDQDYNVGGVAQIVDNKVILYFTGDRSQLLYQLRKGLAELMINESMYGSENYKEMISSSRSVYPEWFIQGAIECISNSWNYDDYLSVGLLVQQEDLYEIIKRQNYESVLVGHALWKYVTQMYGESSISSILYVASLTRDINTAFYYVLAKDLNKLLLELEDLYKKAGKDIRYSQFPETNIKLAKFHAKRNMLRFYISPNEKYFTYILERDGQIKVFLQDLESGKRKKIAKFGHPIKQMVDNTFPVMAWHPTSRVLTYFYEAKGKLFIAHYSPETNKQDVREFHHFEKVLSFDYSTEGSEIVFSGVKKGKTNIYKYHVRTFSVEELTKGDVDNFNPSFIANDTKVVFESNRIQNGVLDSVQKYKDLYKVDASGKQKISKLYVSDATNESLPTEFLQGKYMYLSDALGSDNVFYTNPDSTISHIDTAVHYNYFSKSFPLTYSENPIKNYTTVGNNLYVQFVENGKNCVKKLPIDSLLKVPPQVPFKEVSQNNKTASEESSKINPSNKNKIVDFNNYMFDYETNPYSTYVDSIMKNEIGELKYKSSSIYKTNFYLNQVVNQIDLGFSTSSYQKFNGSQFYYSPRLNIFLKFGVIDLFEDYRLTGRVRLYGDLNSSEYLMSLENLKGRWDRQYIFHRQTLSYYLDYTTYEMNKTYDHLLLGIYKYPFDEVKSLSITPSFRYVKDVALSTGFNSLLKESVSEYWLGLKVEYVYDNIIPIGVNINKGFRAKAFTEFFSQIDKSPTYLFVCGFDARNYQKIHRNIIWASRLAYSYSQGTSPLLYYLGSVDNWINFSSNKTKFNYGIEYDRTQNWEYQAIGTNVRGFQQNIRNGPSFAVLNNEIRFPIVKYFAKRPIKSIVLSNLQLIGFFDVGAAWYGLYPGAKENPYNYTIYGGTDESNITIKIDEKRSPFVCGFGFGLRTRLLGYFVRADWARGIDAGEGANMFYLSLSLDF